MSHFFLIVLIGYLICWLLLKLVIFGVILDRFGWWSWKGGVGNDRLISIVAGVIFPDVFLVNLLLVKLDINNSGCDRLFV